MKKITPIIVLLSVAMITFHSGSAVSHEERSVRSHHSEKHQGDRPFRFLKRAFAHLDLTESQKTSMKALKEDNKQMFIERREALGNIKLEIMQALNASEINENEVTRLSIQAAKLKAEEAIAVAKIKRQAVELLDETQKAKFEKMKQKRLAHMKLKMG